MKSWLRLFGLTVSLAAVSNAGAFTLSNDEFDLSLPTSASQTQIATDPAATLNGTSLESSRPDWLSISDEPSEGSRGVLDRDDRLPMTSDRYPWSAIGQVVTVMPNEYGVCTGTLVADDVVLTNAHCVVNPDTHELYSSEVYFLPNLINGEVANEADIAFAEVILPATDFRDRPQPPHPDDWAFLILDRPLGETYGTIGMAPLSELELLSEDLAESLTLVGYSQDFPSMNPGQTAGVHEGCSVVTVEEDVLFHDCDTTQGSSGGPILGLIDGEYWIVGLNSAEALDESGVGVINFGVQIPRILDQVEQWIAQG